MCVSEGVWRRQRACGTHVWTGCWGSGRAARSRGSRRCGLRRCEGPCLSRIHPPHPLNLPPPHTQTRTHAHRRTCACRSASAGASPASPSRTASALWRCARRRSSLRCPAPTGARRSRCAWAWTLAAAAGASEPPECVSPTEHTSHVCTLTHIYPHIYPHIKPHPQPTSNTRTGGSLGDRRAQGQLPPESTHAHTRTLPLSASPSPTLTRAHAQAVHWAIDELKATVPIWKKEFFADGSVWKENEESRRLLASVQRSEIETAGA